MNQESVNCDILEIEDAKKLLKAIGYKEIMNIKEDNVVYEKDKPLTLIDGQNLIYMMKKYGYGNVFIELKK